jgi:hypothetical protein
VDFSLFSGSTSTADPQSRDTAGTKLPHGNQASYGNLSTAVHVDPYLQVKGLEFNGFSPNLLASGAAGGELCIWDVAAPAQPSLYPALKVCSTIQQPQLSSKAAAAAAAAASKQTAAASMCSCDLHGREGEVAAVAAAAGCWLWNTCICGCASVYYKDSRSTQSYFVCAVICVLLILACPCRVQGPTTGAPGVAAAPEITYISWNRKVQHILASTQVRQ